MVDFLNGFGREIYFLIYIISWGVWEQNCFTLPLLSAQCGTHVSVKGMVWDQIGNGEELLGHLWNGMRGTQSLSFVWPFDDPHSSWGFNGDLRGQPWAWIQQRHYGFMIQILSSRAWHGSLSSTKLLVWSRPSDQRSTVLRNASHIQSINPCTREPIMALLGLSPPKTTCQTT